MPATLRGFRERPLLSPPVTGPFDVSRWVELCAGKLDEASAAGNYSDAIQLGASLKRCGVDVGPRLPKTTGWWEPELTIERCGDRYTLLRTLSSAKELGLITAPFAAGLEADMRQYVDSNKDDNLFLVVALMAKKSGIDVSGEVASRQAALKQRFAHNAAAHNWSSLLQELPMAAELGIDVKPVVEANRTRLTEECRRLNGVPALYYAVNLQRIGVDVSDDVFGKKLSLERHFQELEERRHDWMGLARDLSLLYELGLTEHNMAHSQATAGMPPLKRFRR